MSAEVARHTRMKNANVAGCGRFDVTGWDLTRSDLRIKADESVIVALSTHSAD